MWLLPVLALAATVACDKVPLTAPTGSTITISIDRSVLPLNGQATVAAIVTEAGGTPPHNGTMVTFSSTIGTVTPVEAQTVNGVATAIFQAGSVSGKGTIKAFSGGAVTTTAADVTIGAAAATSIAVSATPSSVSQSGGTVTVAAQVFDASGNLLPGIIVNFSADAGQLSSTTAISDSNGVARTQLTTFQTSKVTATAGAATKDVTVTVTSAPTVTVAAPDTGTVDTPVAFTVTVTSGTSTAPRQVQSLTVDFGDGTSETRSNVTGPVGFTHTYRQARGYTITATAVDVSGNTGVASDSIVINRQQLPTVSITAPATATTTTPVAISTTASTAAPGAQIVNVRVTLQDGTVIYNGSSAGSFNYRFGSAGTYTLTATATDSNGNTATAQTQTTVS